MYTHTYTRVYTYSMYICMHTHSHAYVFIWGFFSCRDVRDGNYLVFPQLAIICIVGSKSASVPSLGKWGLDPKNKNKKMGARQTRKDRRLSGRRRKVKIQKTFIR